MLENDDLRDGIKTYSNWPTIPQLYVKGEFVGGCDIIREMFQAGELQSLLKEKGIAVKEAPKLAGTGLKLFRHGRVRPAISFLIAGAESAPLAHPLGDQENHRQHDGQSHQALRGNGAGEFQ